MFGKLLCGKINLTTVLFKRRCECKAIDFGGFKNPEKKVQDFFPIISEKEILFAAPFFYSSDFSSLSF